MDRNYSSSIAKHAKKQVLDFAPIDGGKEVKLLNSFCPLKLDCNRIKAKKAVSRHRMLEKMSLKVYGTGLAI